MEKQVILNATQLELTLKRLSHELIETHGNFDNSILIGLQPRGIHVATRLKSILESILGHDIQAGNLDITFHRDDFRRREKPLLPSITNIDFSIEPTKPSKSWVNSIGTIGGSNDYTLASAFDSVHKCQ